LLPFAKTGAAAIFVSSLAAHLSKDGPITQILDSNFYPAAMRIGGTYPYAVATRCFRGAIGPCSRCAARGRFFPGFPAAKAGRRELNIASRLSGYPRPADQPDCVCGCTGLGTAWVARIMSIVALLIATPMGTLIRASAGEVEYLRRTPLSREGTMLEWATLLISWPLTGRRSLRESIWLVDGVLHPPYVSFNRWRWRNNDCNCSSSRINTVVGMIGWRSMVSMGVRRVHHA